MHNVNEQFFFEISLSVLNHLGRNLYRSFVTVLGEAISNSWDADAENVWIYIDRKNNNLVIKDDGIGMTKEDFQNKLLKIGYSKRKEADASKKGRPFIGRKGIGKLALLSCARKISIISKTDKSKYIGGVIDNTGLDKAIIDDLTPKQYPLANWEPDIFKQYEKDHKHGTIIYFESINDGIKQNLDFLKKAITLYFRFSLIDKSFNIFIDDEKITNDNLNELAKNTEFLWIINSIDDPYISEKLTAVKEKNTIKFGTGVKGFVASVGKPNELKILGASEKVSIDLFVNGRLRDKDILRHIPTARVVENYLYGQIHFDALDDSVDRFTSSREGVIADDPKYKEFLKSFRDDVVSVILKEWDEWRRDHKKDGDPENTEITTKARKAEELFNAVADDYSLKEFPESKKKVDSWNDGLRKEAAFNFQSYAECFVSENLIRNYIKERKLSLSTPAKNEIAEWKRREVLQKNDGNLSIDIRRNNDDLSYLDMSFLCHAADDPSVQNSLHKDAKEYRPIRNAIAHTAILTDEAKRKLTTVYENIKGRLKRLLSDNLQSQTKMEM